MKSGLGTRADEPGDEGGSRRTSATGWLCVDIVCLYVGRQVDRKECAEEIEELERFWRVKEMDYDELRRTHCVSA